MRLLSAIVALVGRLRVPSLEPQLQAASPPEAIEP